MSSMSDSIDEEFAALVADLPELPPDLPEPQWSDWSEHPVYAELVPAAERLIQLLDLPPAARPTGEIALFDPQLLSPAARIDLLALLEEQKRSSSELIGRVAIRLDLVKEEHVLKALGEQLGMKVIKLSETTIPSELTELVNDRGSTLQQQTGIGPSGAARLLADVGDIHRFRDRDRFASC